MKRHLDSWVVYTGEPPQNHDGVLERRVSSSLGVLVTAVVRGDSDLGMDATGGIAQSYDLQQRSRV